MWPSDLTLTMTLTFQGQVWNFLYLIQKCSNYHKKNSKHIDSWRRHQMETFSALLALCAGNSLVTGEIPAKWPVTRSLDVSVICAWINGWVNDREAGDLRHHRAHYNVTLIWTQASMTIEFDIGHDLEKWGIRIYRKMTRVTSDVDLSSIRLVLYVFLRCGCAK